MRDSLRHTRSTRRSGSLHRLVSHARNCRLSQVKFGAVSLSVDCFLSSVDAHVLTLVTPRVHVLDATGRNELRNKDEAGNLRGFDDGPREEQARGPRHKELLEPRLIELHTIH